MMKQCPVFAGHCLIKTRPSFFQAGPSVYLNPNHSIIFIFGRLHPRRFLHQGGGSNKNIRTLEKPALLKYLASKNLEFKETNNHVVVKVCPFCHDTKNSPDNMWKLNIENIMGMFKCFRCNAHGSWNQFKQRFGDAKFIIETADYQEEDVKDLNPSESDGASSQSQDHVVPIQEKLKEFVQNLTSTPVVANYLTGSEPGQRGLDAGVLELYGVGCTKAKFVNDANEWIEHDCVTFPLVATHDFGQRKSSNKYRVVKYKFRSITEKRCMRLHPKGVPGWGFFGWNTVPEDASSIIITEGEYDAMAVRQQTNLPCISLPTGARNLPSDLIPALDRFKEIIFWMDDDPPGQEGAELFAKKLGLGKCRTVRPSVQVPDLLLSEDKVLRPCKDANDALRMGLDLDKIVKAAQRFSHSNITNFASLRSKVQDQFLRAEHYKGISIKSMPALSRIVKGHRPGELTLVTGSTGVGKTTFLSQYSVDLCGQGIATLWGSFEIKNERLMKTMLTQFAKVDFYENLNLFDQWADRFATLPLYFMKFFGSSPIEDVVEAMEYACSAYNVKHVLLDNLQFMMSGQSGGSDKFDMQDRALQTFRKFATDFDIHITLVVHPRKEIAEKKLTINSIYGSVKSTQEADSVMILHGGTSELERSIEVVKNRFDGQLGSAHFLFDPKTLTLDEVDSPDPPRAQQSESKKPKPNGDYKFEIITE